MMINTIRNLIKRCYVTLARDDSQNYPSSQISYLGKVGDAEILSLYGFSFNAPEGSQGIVFSIAGHEENRVALLNLPKERFKNLKKGEIQIGNFKKGTSIKFDEDGNITITSANDVTINGATNVTINASAKVDINAPLTNLGSGGNKIARLGDQIKVNVGGTDYFGTINSAGTNTSI